MEITTVPVSGVPQFNAPPVVTTVSADPAPVPVPEPPPQVQFPAVATDTPDATNSIDANQQQEEDAARQAALSFKNVYAVSDTDFSIFKDATGQYVTRYVSLRDGSVTYVPQPQYVRPSQQTGVSINA